MSRLWKEEGAHRGGGKNNMLNILDQLNLVSVVWHWFSVHSRDPLSTFFTCEIMFKRRGRASKNVDFYRKPWHFDSCSIRGSDRGLTTVVSLSVASNIILISYLESHGFLFRILIMHPLSTINYMYQPFESVYSMRNLFWQIKPLVRKKSTFLWLIHKGLTLLIDTLKRLFINKTPT